MKDAYLLKGHVHVSEHVRFSGYFPPGAYEPPEGRKERPTAWNGI